MTYDDYHMTMRDLPTSEVRVADFKARLSAYLRRVRRGQVLTLLNRDTPVARVLPWEPGPAALPVRPPTRRLQEVTLPPPSTSPTDSLAALLEERQRNR
jgi:prevent-host-death family protein